MNGWMCPKCGSVYSPMQSECWRCNGVGSVTTSIPPTAATNVTLPVQYFTPSSGFLTRAAAELVSVTVREG